MTIGMLKARFQCLRRLRVTLDRACDIVAYVILHNIATIRGEQCPTQPVNDPDHPADARDERAVRHNMLPSFLIDPSPPQCQINTLCLSFYEVFFISCKYKCSTVVNILYIVQTSKIIHLWAPHSPLTDVPAVVFLFLSFASAALCGQFLNYIFQFVSVSRPCTAVS